MNNGRFNSRHGRLVAAALKTSWRRDPDPCHLTPEELDEIAPILLKSGAAALAWWRLSRTESGQSREDFFQAYKQQTLENAVHEEDVVRVFKILNDARCDALLVKGWAIGRLYPDPALRHYGDLDLCVRTVDVEKARTVLEETAKEIWIDSHHGSAALDGEPELELFERSCLVRIDDVEVRVPSPEDHLRILCLHLLRHGAWRALWLCDVALALESLPANFNWKIFFGNNPRRADWLACVLGLAHQLLGAEIADTPIVARANNLPAWLTRAVLRRWGRWFNSDYRDQALASFSSHKSNLPRLLEDIYFRCDPIRATVETNAEFSNSSRLPYQLLTLLRGTSEVVSRVVARGADSIQPSGARASRPQLSAQREQTSPQPQSFDIRFKLTIGSAGVPPATERAARTDLAEATLALNQVQADCGDRPARN
jgi:hypothetical protein